MITGGCKNSLHTDKNRSHGARTKSNTKFFHGTELSQISNKLAFVQTYLLICLRRLSVTDVMGSKHSKWNMIGNCMVLVVIR